MENFWWIFLVVIVLVFGGGTLAAVLTEKSVDGSMKSWFCDHIWKVYDKEYLYSTIWPSSSVVAFRGENDIRKITNYYALKYKCVKCGKYKLEEISNSKWKTY